MKSLDEFFAGTNYAIFGIKARGRAHGPVVITALRKAGKTPIAIEADGSGVKNAEVRRLLSEAGAVDGAILLPPTPWDDEASKFMADAVSQCRQMNVPMWVYVAGDSAPAEAALSSEGVSAVVGKCPCLYIIGGGFPHNLHRWMMKISKQL